MSIMGFETSIANFLALGRRLQAVRSLTGQRVLDDLTAWYRDSRVDGAELDEDADMVLLQWGSTRPLVVSEPTDLRGRGDGEIKFAERAVKYLNFTRQVFAPGDDKEVEFDDAAVQMSITLGFDPTDGTEPNSNRWIRMPSDIDSGRREFLDVPFVKTLVGVPARTIAITVYYCG